MAGTHADADHEDRSADLTPRPTMPAPRLLALLPALGCAAATAALLPTASGTFACRYKDFAHCAQGDASVTLQDGKVQAVSFSASFCANKRQAVGECRLEARRGGPLVWADEAGKATVQLVDPRHPQLDDALAVLLGDDTIVLDLSETQGASHCSGGGDLPEKVVIDPVTQACRVTF